MKIEKSTNLQNVISEVNIASERYLLTTRKIVNDFDLALERVLKVFKNA